jgi:hypothetical protein
VVAEMPVPDGANIEGSSDLTCDVSGNTDGRRLYEVYQGNRVGDQLTAQGLFTWVLDKGYSDTMRGAQCTSADAAGFPIAALAPTRRREEVRDVSVRRRRDRADVRRRPDQFSHVGGSEVELTYDCVRQPDRRLLTFR